ncbi:protein kinase [Streptomyces kaniharaensis]|uniref:Protein kinase n=1 Tax=Streptomyces kaniharaensis TaxID=212423 RepID=A0A6N7KYY2_9ACTN|nr:serine/threonine-protein kinase [Streptomyces kaniharaensis]MQS16842.1 protein kinase [Streptomyces kaniharaensis]
MDDRTQQDEGERPTRGSTAPDAVGDAPLAEDERRWELPDYVHERELGAGASGRVVLARHRESGTPVALKYLHGSVGTPALRAEARVLASIDSPHVTRLYEYVEGEQGSAIVMELVDGIALRDLLRAEGATTAEAALVVLKGSLLGLAAAHEAGVVHRDYKPANVLVDTAGVSKLVDFGIAVPNGADRDVSGTPAYMPPEQWAGRPASPAGDVYAATVTFFECLTGARPYEGTTIAELAVQHTEAPIPAELAPDPVRPLILAGLAKDPQSRPDSAAAFVEELEAVAVAAYGPQWEEKGRLDLAALVALLALLPGAGGAAAGGTSLAHTALGSGEGLFAAHVTAAVGADTVAATVQRDLTRRGLRLGTRGKALTGVAAGVLTLATLAGAAMAGAADGGARTAAGGASPEATTSLGAPDPTGGPSPVSSGAGTPSPAPSASTSPTATPSATPGTPSGGPTATPTGQTPTVPGSPPRTGTPTGQPPAPPGPAGPASVPPAGPVPTTPGPTSVTTTPPPSPTVAPATIAVSSVNLDSLVCGGRWSLTATVTVVAQGNATGTLTLSWYHSSGGRAITVATDTVVVQNGRATVTRTHDFGSADNFPTWGVRIGTTPAAAQPGRTSAEMAAFLCDPPR